MLQCRVNFLDDTYFVWELERNALGQDLFNKVCQHLDLLESDYFGLAMWDSPITRVWLDCAKEIHKQIKSPVTEFFFSIKFYPPDPSTLAEDISRYLICLQLRKDILIGRLSCPSDVLALLGSYTVQSTLGDYDPILHKDNYVSEIVLAPNQSEELEQKVMELHSTYRFMSPAQADILFLENVMELPMYGVDLHPAKDGSGADVMLGVCSEGLMVYEEDIKTNRFLWSRVLKLSHKRNTFLLKMRPSEEDEFESDVSFSLANYKACKQLWKCCVEHHSFFRNRLQDTKAKRLLTLGSRFRYHGRTQSECLEASGNITRAPPQFTRYIIRKKANEEILDVIREPVRTELDDWFLVYGPEKWRIYTSDDVLLESQTLQEWKHQADDWCVLLDGSPFSLSGVQQLLLTEEQREDKEVMEGSEKRITDELVTKQSYTVQVVQEGCDIIEKGLSDFEQEIMRPLNETLQEQVQDVSGEGIRRVVITKQWTQTQEDGEKMLERVEMVERRVMVTEEKKLRSEDTFKRLEIMQQKLEEVEAIERKLVEVEELRVGLQEVESLEQRLQQVEKEEIQLERKDDWYIFLDRRPLMLTATPIGRSGSVQEELQQIVYIPKPMKKEDDWYILFNVLPQTMEIQQLLSDVSSSIPEEYQAEEETREVERKIQQELPPEKPKSQTEEEVIQSRVRTEEKLKVQQQQVSVDYRRSQTAVLEQRAAEPQTDEEDDWFAILDGSRKKSVPSVRNTSVELDEETRVEEIQSRVRTEQKQQQEQLTVDYERPQPVILEERTAQPQRDVEDDWFIIWDVSPKGSVPLALSHLQNPTTDQETREEVIRSGVRAEEVQKRQIQQVTPQPQPVLQEQRTTQPQRDVEDSWFLIWDVSPKESVRGPAVELYEERREEVIQSRVRQEERVIETVTKQITVPEERKRTSIVQIPQFPVVPREVDDDWFELFDKEPFEQKSLPSVRGPAVELYEEHREEVIQSRVRQEERVIETVTKQITVPEEKKRTSIVQIPQFPVVPREVDDDWFELFDKEPYEQKSLPSVRGPAVELYEEHREEVIQSRVRQEERVIETVTKQITVPEERKRTSIAQIPQFPVVPREVDDDWFELFDKEPFEQKSLPSVRGPAVELYEEHREEVIQSRVRQEERVIETVTKQITVPEEKKRTSIVQIPQFPVVPREVDDDWFELFDKEPYEQKSLPSDVRTRDFEVREPKDQRVEEQREDKRLVTEEKRVTIDEWRKTADVVPQMIPVGIREVDDDWFELLDSTPSEKRSVPSVPVVTEERRMKEQEERRVRQQQMRVREEDERRLREQEKQKQELEARRAQPSITVPTKAHPQIDDDWFILFDASTKETVVAEIIKVDRRAEEEQRRREEERRKRTKVEERPKRAAVPDERAAVPKERAAIPKERAAIPEDRPVQLQTEVEDDWFTLMGISLKDYIPTLPHTPVVSPVAPPKPRPQIPADQPLTSTPTSQPVSITKTYQERIKDTLDITMESEAETESVLMRRSQTWTKRIEGESVYVRHSILMLEDFNVSQEIILKHHASITELKRVFMEVKQDFGPTEWDRRLSSYSPGAKAQLPHANGEILTRMGLIEDDGKTV